VGGAAGRLQEDLEKAEFAGFPVVFIILLAVFGSLAAALLPFSLGVAAVVLTGAAVYFLSQTLQMSVFVTNIASMLGIGVAVDYSLFILSRYRRSCTTERPETARATAMRTSGLAVFVSGVTVVISLAGLFLIDSKTMRSMAIGAIVVVAIAVLAAMTLLPC
jgi:RND superfamily putative drug exporter